MFCTPGGAQLPGRCPVCGWPVVEPEEWFCGHCGAPSRRSSGSYYHSYGAGGWDSSTSAIGYATCDSPLGPCTDRSTGGPWLDGDPDGDAPVGPQGPAVFVDRRGRIRLGFAAWNGRVGYPRGVRSLWIAALSFEGGVPRVG
jgi:hypothetical protein